MNVFYTNNPNRNMGSFTTHNPTITQGGITYFGILKRWNGVSWLKEPLKTFLGDWVVKPLKRWNGETWVDVDIKGV